MKKSVKVVEKRKVDYVEAVRLVWSSARDRSADSFTKVPIFGWDGSKSIGRS